MTETRSFTSCGTCRACCIVPSIKELNKPAGVACLHLNPKENSREACTIYQDRPATCSNYQCFYTTQVSFPIKYRPDKSGVIIEVQQNPVTATHVFVFQEVYSGAASQKLMQMAARKLATQLPVCIRKPDGSMKWILGLNHKHLRTKLQQIAISKGAEDRVQIILA